MTIYEFSNYRDFLNAAAQRYYGRKNRPFSLNVWAKRLGFKSPRSVAMVLKGQRYPSQQMIVAIAKNQRLGERELRYFELLVKLEREKARGRDVRAVLEGLKRLAPSSVGKAKIDLNIFAYISEWYHLVIKQLIARPDFVEDAAWIRQKLRKKVTEAEIRQAIETMLSLKVLGRDPVSGCLTVGNEGLTTTHDVPSAAIRSHHEQMMVRAKEALYEQDVGAREFGALVFKMDPKRILEAKKRLRQFRDEFEREYSSHETGDVYQFNFQLFSHMDQEE